LANVVGANSCLWPVLGHWRLGSDGRRLETAPTEPFPKIWDAPMELPDLAGCVIILLTG
jgi:hypothetical protein